MATQLEPSIVRIRKSNGTVVGAGFLVQEKYVLTCAHVVAQALGISLYTPEKPLEDVHLDFPSIEPGKILKARVVIWREVQENNSFPPPEDGEDIAVLKLETDPPVGAIPAPLLSKNNLEAHRFAAFGFPDGHDNGVWAYGVLCGRQGAGWVQIEAEKEPGFRVEPGFSGTPIWDKKLKGIVGIAVAADLERIEAKVAFMIPTELLVKAWSKLGEWTIPPLIPGKTRAKGSWRSRPLAWASLVLVPVLSATAFLLPQVRGELGIGQSSCFYQARKQGKQAIGVAKFDKSVTNSIINSQIENQIKDRLGYLPNVKICPIDKSVSLLEDARKVGKKLKSEVVVWGRGGGSTLEVYVTAVNINVRYLAKLSLPTASSYDFDLQTKDWQHIVPVMAAFNLSQVYEKEGKIQEAIETLNSGIELAELMIPESNNQETVKRMSYAYYFLGNLYAPTTDWHCLKNRANCENGLQAYRDSWKWNKKFTEALRSQGLLYERLGKLTEAVDVYTQIIQSAPNAPSNFNIRKYRAEIRLKQGKAVEAIEDFKFVCQQQPNDTDCLRSLGLSQLQANNIEGARDTYKDIRNHLIQGKTTRAEIINDLQSTANKKPDLIPVVDSIIAVINQ
jgi:tetratricopeptide (TPR) repeat protein/S1-C subfamily serine protease